jgi:dipeptidyl aminopeptidase/acylaminoacyl peptidase
LKSETQTDLHRAISPQGNRLAVVIQSTAGLDLDLIQVPGAQLQTIAHLLSITPEQELDHPTSTNALALDAIRDYQNIAWQPGTGRLLAFTGALAGGSSNLYLYDTQTGKTSQLTSGPFQAVFPNWSPDGQYLLYFGVSWTAPFGAIVLGPNQLDGVWALHVPDGKLISLSRPLGVEPNFVGWLDNTHYLTFDSETRCFAQNLRSVDVTSGQSTVVMNNSFYFGIARSPLNGTLLFSSVAGCPSSLGEGVFMLPAGRSSPIKLLDQNATGISWLAESGVFQAYPLALVSADGSLHYDPPVAGASYLPAISKQGSQAWEVIDNQLGHVEVRQAGGVWQTVMYGPVAQLIWDPLQGRTLFIALSDGTLYAATAPDFTPRSIGDLGGNVNQAIWSP